MYNIYTGALYNTDRKDFLHCYIHTLSLSLLFFYFRRPEFFCWRLLYIPSRRTGRQTRTGTTSLKKKKKYIIIYVACHYYKGITAKTITSLFRTYILYRHRRAHTRFPSPAAAMTGGNYALVHRMQNTLFFFLLYTLLYYSTTT